jgi:serine/threonine protein phosphatase PrpC
MFKQIKEVFKLKDTISHFSFDAENSRKGFELVAYGDTDKGAKRGGNEDSFLLLHLNDSPHSFEENGANLECLMAVADGLGHDRRGQIASELAVDILRSSFYLPSVQTPMQRLVSSVEIANQRIFNRAEHDFSLKGMATTMTAVYVKGENVYVAHLGNSRAYVIRDGQLIQLTKDQTLAQALKEIGDQRSVEISETAYKTLLQAVGTEPFVDIWQASFELKPDDMLLVCSDGLTSELTEREIVKIIEQNANFPKTAVRKLIEAANELSGKDNITVIVAHFRHNANLFAGVPLANEFRQTSNFQEAA